MGTQPMLLASCRNQIAAGTTIRGDLIGDHLTDASCYAPDGWPLTAHPLEVLAKRRFRVGEPVDADGFFGPHLPELDALFRHLQTPGWGTTSDWRPEKRAPIEALLERHQVAVGKFGRVPRLRLRVLSSYQELADNRKLMLVPTPYNTALARAGEARKAPLALSNAAWRAGRLSIYRLFHAVTEPIFSAAVGDFAGGFTPRDAGERASVVRQAALVTSVLAPKAREIAPYFAEVSRALEGTSETTDAPARDALLEWLISDANEAVEGHDPTDAHLVVAGAGIALGSWWSLVSALKPIVHNSALAIIVGDREIRSLYEDLLAMVDVGAIPLGVTETNEFRVFVRPMAS